MSSKSYHTNNGLYQERAEFYYDKLSNNDFNNTYLDVYRCVVNCYANFHHFGIRFFDKHHTEWEEGLKNIRETHGLARCWGHADNVLDIISRWRAFLADIRPLTNAEADIDEQVITVEANASSELLADALESLMDSVLEVLPAYVPWTPTAVLADNQPIIDFLQARGNVYRALGNPKFYAYDRAVLNLANTAIPITVSNCKFFKGVGPRINQHIIDFLNGKVENVLQPILNTTPSQGQGMGSEDEPTLTPNQGSGSVNPSFTQEPILIDLVSRESSHINPSPDQEAGYTVSSQEPGCVDPSPDQEAGHTVSSQEPGCVDPSPDQEAGHTVPSQELTSWRDQEPPQLVRVENEPLARYLWENSLRFHDQNYKGHAWAWRRAAETVYSTDRCIEDYLHVLGDKTIHFPYIGVTMADVIREFYQYEVQNWKAECSQNLPLVCPEATINTEDRELQQQLLSTLWDNGYQRLAVEIADSVALPQTRSDFESFDNYNPNVLELIFSSNGDIPVARNWINTDLVKWLWDCGNETIGTVATNYYNAAHAVARKINIVNIENLQDVKYIGPHIAQRARGELAGIIDPEQYRNMCKELEYLRRRVKELESVEQRSDF